MNNARLIQYFAGYYWSLRKEKKFIKEHFEQFLQKKADELNYTFSKADWKKTTVYYPCFTVLAGAENFILLKGKRKLSEEERYRLTAVSIMSGLCDDLIDEENWAPAQLFDLLENHLEALPLSPKAKLILSLNEALYKTHHPDTAYEKQLRTAIYWQARSLDQLNPGISTDEILQISKEKNGQTSLMFSYLLDEEWTDVEKEVIAQSGFLGQLVNDTYDIFKDIAAGVQTYLQRYESLAASEHFFIAEWRKLVRLIRESNATNENKQHLINRFACVHGYALVAFHQFSDLEQKYGMPVKWSEATRKELVIDMEKWPTRWQLLKAIKKLSTL